MPEDNLHENRPQSLPTDGVNGIKNCFSRTDILNGKTPVAFGSAQSLSITSGGETDDPATWPKNWPRAGRLLRVPKTVILSSFPFWTLYWPLAYFFYPRDVIGSDGSGNLVNYYYLEQWNGIDPADDTAPDYSYTQTGAYDLGNPTAVSTDNPGYQNDPVWGKFTFLTSADKATTYNARQQCMALNSGDDPACNAIPSYIIDTCPIPPLGERFKQGVCTVENPYYTIHPKLLEAFKAVKDILENDPDDPIYVVIPAWMPEIMHQTRNSFLKQDHQKLNGAHGGSPNKQPCDVRDIFPCYVEAPICWAPAYPDIADPRNQMGFDGPQVPWLLTADPGFGTNTLHLYIGHPNMAYNPTSSPFDYQAWPLTPEVQYIAGPVFQGSYIGTDFLFPFFAGRRSIWESFGFDYGYINHGAKGLYDNRYGGIVEGAAGGVKDNFLKYRNFGTRLFTYDAQWSFGWQFGNLIHDRRNDCAATQFYFGFDFADYAPTYDNEDDNINDCQWKDGIKVGETVNFFPAKRDINAAMSFGVKLARRVEDYYTKNDAGAGEFFKYAIDKNDLDKYNVKYEGPLPNDMLGVDGLVTYIRNYFAENP